MLSESPSKLTRMVMETGCFKQLADDLHSLNPPLESPSPVVRPNDLCARSGEFETQRSQECLFGFSEVVTRHMRGECADALAPCHAYLTRLLRSLIAFKRG